MPRILHGFRSPLLLILVLLLGGSFTTTARAEGIESRNYVWDISFPLEKNRGSYEQGWHMCRDSGCTRAHRAVDFYAPPGTPVYAAADGEIVWRRTSAAGDWSPTSGSGYALYMDAPGGNYRHFYGHFGPDEPGREAEAFAINPDTGEFWKVGDTVKRGQRLGWVGTSGATASGPHLHFELRSIRPGYPTDDPGDDAIEGRSYGDPEATVGSFRYLRWDPFYSLQAAESREDYPAGDPEVGDYVRVVGVNQVLNMRGPEACDSPISGEGRPAGMVGRVIEGPVSCPEVTSSKMWRIQWSDCKVGWSSQVFLEVVPAGEVECPELEVSLEMTGEGEVVVNPDQPSYPAGAELEVEATAADGFEFSHWSGDFSGSENPLALVIGSDLVLAAHFRRTYEAWEAAQFTSAERETEGLTAPENDAFGSGLANLAVYAFGLNVRAPDRSALPRVERGDDGFVFVFPRLNHADDLSYVVEVSPDLSAWSFLPVDEGQWEVIDVPETSTELVRVTLTADPGGATHFVRLRIEREV